MNDDLMIAFAEVTLNNKQILKIMKGNTKVWPSGDIAVIYIKQLDNATCDINQLRVSLHSPLTGTLVPNTDCVMINLSITMGGVDITSSAYDSSDGSISIEEVTDDVVISAIASPVIVFADSTVKSLCVSNWGGNYLQNEITEYEAAQVTSLNGVFKANNQISSFNELKYFTGITSLYNDYTNSAYNGQLSFCSNLTKITLPAAPISNWGGAFRQTPAAANTGTITLDMTPITAQEITLNAPWRECYRLVYIKLDGKVYKGSMQYGFRNCGILTTIEINGTADFTQVTNYFNCFYSCANLTTITGTIVGISQDIDIHWSPLTRASAMVLINGLAQVATAKKITFSYYTYNLLSETDIAIATNKGWQVETIIEWEDNNLRDYILAQFPNNVGLTYSGQITNLELASITSLNNKFVNLAYFDENNTKPFYTFNEFRFFTGLTGFSQPANAQGEFYACGKLQYITFPSITIIGAVDFRGLFRTCNALKSVDLSPVKTTSFYRIYYMCAMSMSVSVLTDVTLPSGVYGGGSGGNTYSRAAFQNCSRLTTLNIDGVADFSGITSTQVNATSTLMFTNCSSLTTITGTIINIKVDISFGSCPLTHDTALMLLNGLYDLTGGTQQTITFSASTYATLTASEIAIATSKNWQVASA